jgi:hypothetical protein
VDTSFVTKKTVFKFGSNQGDVHVYDPTVRTGEFGAPIVSFVQGPFMPDENAADVIYHFESLKIQARGVGNLDITLTDSYATQTKDPPGFPLTLSPARVLYRQVNFESEYMGVQLGTDSANEWFELISLKVLAAPIWENLAQDA